MSRSGFLLAILVVSIQLSCSVNLDRSPVIADSNASPSINDAGSSSRYLWGYRLFRYDPSDHSLVSIPLRSAEFHLNAVRMLEVTLCQDCLKISNAHLVQPDQLSVDL